MLFFLTTTFLLFKSFQSFLLRKFLFVHSHNTFNSVLKMPHQPLNFLILFLFLLCITIKHKFPMPSQLNMSMFLLLLPLSLNIKQRTNSFQSPLSIHLFVIMLKWMLSTNPMTFLTWYSLQIRFRTIINKMREVAARLFDGGRWH